MSKMISAPAKPVSSRQSSKADCPSRQPVSKCSKAAGRLAKSDTPGTRAAEVNRSLRRMEPGRVTSDEPVRGAENLRGRMNHQIASGDSLRYGKRATNNKSTNADATGLSMADDYDQSLIAKVDNLRPGAEVEYSCHSADSTSATRQSATVLCRKIAQDSVTPYQNSYALAAGVSMADDYDQFLIAAIDNNANRPPGPDNTAENTQR